MTGHSYVGSTPCGRRGAEPDGPEDDRAERRPGVDVPPPVPGGRPVHAPVDRRPVVVQLPDGRRRPAAGRRRAGAGRQHGRRLRQQPGGDRLRRARLGADRRRGPVLAAATPTGTWSATGTAARRRPTSRSSPSTASTTTRPASARSSGSSSAATRRTSCGSASGTTASGCCPNRRGIQWTAALHAWFDKHLARRKVKTGPPVELFMSDDQSFAAVATGARTEIAHGAQRGRSPTASSRFFPTADGGMGRTAPAEEGSQSFTGTPEGFTEFANEDPTWKTGVSFATEPFDRGRRHGRRADAWSWSRRSPCRACT